MAIHTVGSGKDFATIQGAINDAGTVNGDSIEIYNGTYTEVLTINKQLTVYVASANSITLNPAGGQWLVTISESSVDFNMANMTFSPTSGGAALLYINKAAGTGINIHGLNITSFTNYGASFIYVNAGSTTIYDNILNATNSASTTGIGVKDAGDVTIRNNLFRMSTTADYAIRILDAMSVGNVVKIYNNICDSNAIFLDMAAGTNEAILIYNNTIYHTNWYGIKENTGTLATIKNNIFEDCIEEAIESAAGTSYLTLDYNFWYSNTTDISGAASKGANAVNGIASGMVDPANDDFTIASNSECTDVGLNLSSVFTDDYAGITRTVPWDIGAYNYAAAPGGGGTPTLGLMGVGS